MLCPVAGFDGGWRPAAADGVPVVPAGDVLPAAAARHPAAQRQRAARPGAAHAHLQVLRGLHPPARALRQRRQYTFLLPTILLLFFPFFEPYVFFQLF